MMGSLADKGRNWLLHLFLNILCPIWLLNCHSTLAEHLIQTINGSIHGEEYTYYRVDGVGHLRLELNSWQGDADLYISADMLHPNFENYDFKSTTCGLDTVDIPSTFERPVGVGVYGHPGKKNETRYSLSVYFVSKSDGDDYDYLDSLYNHYTYEMHEGKAEAQQSFNQKNKHNPALDQESASETISETLWTILVTILKIFFEILL